MPHRQPNDDDDVKFIEERVDCSKASEPIVSVFERSSRLRSTIAVNGDHLSSRARHVVNHSMTHTHSLPRLVRDDYSPRVSLHNRPVIVHNIDDSPRAATPQQRRTSKTACSPTPVETTTRKMKRSEHKQKLSKSPRHQLSLTQWMPLERVRTSERRFSDISDASSRIIVIRKEVSGVVYM